jgi:regulator of protease activity HflC (stomatin/prohibitin superfamily)
MKEVKNIIKPKQIIIIIICLAAIITLFIVGGNIFEVNNAGYYQVIQAAVTGKMSVRATPGLYAQLFADVITYQISDMYYFSKLDIEGGSGIEADPIKVRFNDGGTAEISGSIKFRLSMIADDQLQLHEDFKGYDAVKQDLVRQVVTEALMQTATLMKAEESYSTRRSEFTALAEGQIRDGIYATIAQEKKMLDAEGNEFIDRTVFVKMDEVNSPEIRKLSPFKRYNIEVLQFVIKDIDFDDTIDALIAKKKEAEQEKVVARAKAEKAKQDAITAEEQGKARIAQAKADEEVEKIKAVTQAQKEYEVAKLNRLKAEEQAAADLTKKEAEAKAAALLVKAGLTPREKAEIQKETAIGVAAEMAKIEFPKLMIFGGASGSPTNPFDAVGLQAFQEIIADMAE